LQPILGQEQHVRFHDCECVSPLSLCPARIGVASIWWTSSELHETRVFLVRVGFKIHGGMKAAGAVGRRQVFSIYDLRYTIDDAFMTREERKVRTKSFAPFYRDASQTLPDGASIVNRIS
jgi:hypothetical protein